MHTKRNRERIAVDVPVVVTTVLDSLEGRIIDLSEGGAQILGCTLPTRSKCQLDLDGHIVFGTVQWSEEDRIGIRFPYDLTDGPLYERLEQARTAKHSSITLQPSATMATTGSGFGRRAD
ncbi:PilZ domain-containing protein [Sphingobium sp. BYY-5]|uniref:PilZ domain-containing protein n=1 Tax=Sphingobium sp. BYY-5 TaxID=2926400 RepID=UPI001FA7D98E|nr:PilZ domain-containing protein [Sphingobium sp. BYY-5]MCI4591386.1 PilZ domain-containing protein [Sphingobium sp. BYY-5]